jgi:hypothetical protein
LSCAICEIRKEKRFCPAVHARICPQCCGEQREVTLDCPSDCGYLQQAREHEKPRSAEQFDAASLFQQVEISEQFTYEREHLLMGLSYALAKAAHADRSLNDRDLIAALSAMCTRQERLVNSGLHYDEPLASGAQHAAAGHVEEMLKQFREAEQKQLGHTTCAIPTCSERWRSWFGWVMDAPLDARDRGPSSIFSLPNFPRSSRRW